jgi:hypothetical protein
MPKLSYRYRFITAFPLEFSLLRLISILWLLLQLSSMIFKSVLIGGRALEGDFRFI